MNIFRYTCMILILIGAINWGLVGAFNFDLVAFIFGNMSIISRIIVDIYLIFNKNTDDCFFLPPPVIG